MKKTLLAILIVATPLCIFAQLPSYLPTEGLVGWWPFNGNANDESGNGNDGVVNGAILTQDRFNNNSSAYIVSSTQTIVIDNPLSGQLNNFTITAWINANESTELSRGFFFLHRAHYHDASLYINYNNNTVASDLAFNWLANQTISIESPFLYQQWTHVAVVYENPSYKLYVNGILTAQINSPYGSFDWSTNNCWNTFGSNSSTSTSLCSGNYTGMSGSVDDFCMYNRALSQSEISELYFISPTEGENSSTTVPAAIAYQAVARNAQGQPLSDAAVQVKFTLLADSLSGATEYSESHSLTTNSLGLFTTAFGVGTPLSGTFAGINWAAGSKYLKVELDAGSGFVDMGTQQLLSVPYAIQAKKSTLLENNALPVYSGNAAALAGGLVAGQLYRTATGDLKIVY